MKICDKAIQSQSKINSISHNGSYFVNPIFGSLASIPTALFTPHRVRHEWIIIESTGHAIYCIQFSGSDSKKAEITMEYYSNIESANEAGMRVAGTHSYHEVNEKRPAKDYSIGDFIHFLENCDDNYNLLTNNCQTLTSKLYAKFADITLNDVMCDHEKAKNTLGFTREIDGSTTITCQIL